MRWQFARSRIAYAVLPIRPDPAARREADQRETHLLRDAIALMSLTPRELTDFVGVSADRSISCLLDPRRLTREERRTLCAFMGLAIRDVLRRTDIPIPDAVDVHRALFASLAWRRRSIKLL